jgi:hypothetical protein
MAHASQLQDVSRSTVVGELIPVIRYSSPPTLAGNVKTPAQELPMGAVLSAVEGRCPERSRRALCTGVHSLARPVGEAVAPPWARA